MGQSVKYRLADGLEIELRVPTLLPADDAASLALQELNDSDDMLDKILGKASDENDPVKALAIKGRMREIRQDRLKKFRVFLAELLKKQMGSDDVDNKVIPQCTDADIVTILRDCREGPGWRVRWLSMQGFSPSDVLAMASQFTPEVKAALSESLKPTPVSPTQPGAITSGAS